MLVRQHRLIPRVRRDLQRPLEVGKKRLSWLAQSQKLLSILSLHWSTNSWHSLEMLRVAQSCRKSGQRPPSPPIGPLISFQHSIVQESPVPQSRLSLSVLFAIIALPLLVVTWRPLRLDKGWVVSWTAWRGAQLSLLMGGGEGSRTHTRPGRACLGIVSFLVWGACALVHIS